MVQREIRFILLSAVHVWNASHCGEASTAGSRPDFITVTCVALPGSYTYA